MTAPHEPTDTCEAAHCHSHGLDELTAIDHTGGPAGPRPPRSQP